MAASEPKTIAMRNTLAALALLLAVTPAAVAEDPESRRHCLALLARAVSASGELLAGFTEPGLSIPAHTLRGDEGALHCLFLSNENALLYTALVGGKAFAFTLKPDSTFEIPLSR